MTKKPDKLSQWIERYLCDLKKANLPEYTTEKLWELYHDEKKHYNFQNLEREVFAVKVSRARARVKKVKDIDGRLDTLPSWSKLREPIPNEEITEVKSKLKFLNEFFKSYSEYLFQNPDIVDYIEKNAGKFDEVEQLCQA